MANLLAIRSSAAVRTDEDLDLVTQIRPRIDHGLRRLLADPAHAALPKRMRAPAIRALVGTIDAVQVVFAGMVVSAVGPTGPAFRLAEVLGVGIVAGALAAIIFQALRVREHAPDVSVALEAARVTGAVLAAFGLIGWIGWLGAAEATTLQDVWHILLPWACISAAGSGLVRVAAATFERRSVAGGRLVVVGPATEVASLAESRVTGRKWQIVGHVDDRDPAELDQLVGLASRQEADLVLLTGADAARRAASVCERLAEQPFRVRLAFDRPALANVPRRRSALGHLALMDLIPDPHEGSSRLIKRMIDVTLSCLAIVVLAPVLVLAAITIRIESPGPVLFSQWRFGLGNQPIRVFKFRSMYVNAGDANGQQRTTRRDPRVTRVGRVLRRTSIDELPQLINVLRGEMSLVGPRPHPLHMQVEGNYYFEAVDRYRTRHLVRPGITGWAQINGLRGEVDTIEKAYRRVDLDLWYIANWSIRLDLGILLRTAFGGFATFSAD